MQGKISNWVIEDSTRRNVHVQSIKDNLEDLIFLIVTGSFPFDVSINATKLAIQERYGENSGDLFRIDFYSDGIQNIGRNILNLPFKFTI